MSSVTAWHGIGDGSSSPPATWTDPVLKNLAKSNATVPGLPGNNPSFEKVLDAEPDFVTSSFVSTLDKGGIATRHSSRNSAYPPTSRPPTAPRARRTSVAVTDPAASP